MKTVIKETEISFEEKKSKFIGYIKPVKTTREAEEFVEYIKLMHPNATHNCSCYRVVENGQEYYKPDDDGEPSGTAGKPIGEIFINLDIYNLAVVVTRYFGGIKLGAGGLIRNYAKTSKLAVLESGIEEYVEKNQYILDFSYGKSGEIDRFIVEEDIEINDRVFEERVSYRVLLSKEQKSKLENINDLLIIGV